MSRPSPGNRFDAVHSLPELQGVVTAIHDPDELYAIRGTNIRKELERIATEVAAAREPILSLLHSLDECRPGRDLGPIAAAFRQQVTALTEHEEGEPEEEAESAAEALAPALLDQDPDAAATLEQLLLAPGDDAQRFVAADALDDSGLPARAALLRLEVLLRDPMLPAPEREALLAQRRRAEYDHLRQTFDRFHLPWPGDWRWDEQAAAGKQEQRETPATAALTAFTALDARAQVLVLQSLLRLPEQYASQHDLLHRDGLLEEQNDHDGITGIDGQPYPLPSSAALIGRLHGGPQEGRTLLFAKALQGFTELLLDPFALPLTRRVEAWRRNLRRNEHRLQAHGGLDREQPLWTLEEAYGLRDGLGPDEDGRLVYSPRRFERDNHGGRTKLQLLTADPSNAWQVLLAEPLTNLPRRGQGQTLAGRRQREAGRSPREYLASPHPDEIWLTLDSYVAAFCAQLERTGQPLDAETVSCLLSSYLPTSGVGPDACWDPGGRRAGVSPGAIRAAVARTAVGGPR